MAIKLDSQVALTQPNYIEPLTTTLAAHHRFHIPFRALHIFCATADLALIVTASVIGGCGYQLAVNGSWGRIDWLAAAGLFAGLLHVFSAWANGLYQLERITSFTHDRRKILFNWLMVSLGLILVTFLLKVGAEFSRGSMISFGVLAAGFLVIGRTLMARFIATAIASGRVEGKRVLIIGAREELASIDTLTLLQGFGLSEIGRVELSNDRGMGFSLSAKAQQALSDALDLCREKSASEIVLVFAWSNTRLLDLLREALRASPLPVQLLPDRMIRSLATNPSFTIKPSLALEIQRAPLSSLERLVKRSFDIFGSIVGLALLAPIMIFAAAAIKLDSEGPILFRQRRNGFNTKQFQILKFRSMTVMEDGPTVVQARKHDPRVTRVGRILRQSSIDELPQLINVLRGEMSLVGPRPHALAHDDHYGQVLAEYAFRHYVKPGITGWAQVNGYRGETPHLEQMKRRVELDLWYINNWSPVLDLKILALTCIEMIRRRNAH